MNDYLHNHLYVHENKQEVVKFNHPTCKSTFQSLPKIYGRKKKGKPMIIAKLRQQVKKINEVTEETKEKEQSRVFDPEVAEKLSKPKHDRCDKKNCPCHYLSDDTYDHHQIKFRRSREKNKYYTEQKQRVLQPKYSSRTYQRVALPSMKNFNLDDLESNYKVSFKRVDTQRIDNESGLSRIIQIEKRKKESLKSENNLIPGIHKKINSINIEKLQKVIRLQKQQRSEKESDYQERYPIKKLKQTRNSVTSGHKVQNILKSSQNGKRRKEKFRRLTQMKDQSFQIDASTFLQKYQNEEEQDDVIPIKKRINAMTKDRIKTQPNQKSSRNGIALSSHLFRGNQIQNTQFHRFKKSLEKDSRVSEKRSIISSKMSYTYFRIPSQKDYLKFLAAYNPLDPNLNIKELVKSERFSIIKEDYGVYFGQVNEEQNKSGRGITITERQIFQGIYQNNLKVSGYERTLDGIFKGSYINGLRSGKGFLKLVNGQTFEGTWKNGKKNGFIKWTSPSGDSCEGQWKNDQQHGRGIFKHKMSTYQGQFQNFLKHGQGQEIFMNGDSYKGQYKKGKPEGKGIYKWNNGIVYEGEFINGMRDGYGKLVDSDGTVYEGNFKEDFKHGFAKESYKSGERYEGNFDKGSRTNGRIYNSKGIQIDIIQQ